MCEANAGGMLPPQCRPSGRPGCPASASVDGKEVLWLTGEIAPGSTLSLVCSSTSLRPVIAKWSLGLAAPPLPLPGAWPEPRHLIQAQVPIRCVGR